MFQFLRRVSTSLLPRPDRPWRDDATSHAPTIGRKRRYSLTERDEADSPSAPKRTKNDLVMPSPESDSASEGESPKGVPSLGVKEVVKGVKEVDLEDKEVADAPSIRPEGVPLPDSPSGSPEPADPANPSAEDEAKDTEHADDRDSVASSAPEDDAEGSEDSVGAGTEDIATNTDVTTVETTPAQEVIITAIEATPETLEVRA